MGKSPCCDKEGVKKGPWSPEEDQKLLAYIDEHGHGSWRALPGKAGLQRCGKSCRLRWTNYLRPDIKRGKFSSQEEQTIIQLHALLGNRWSAIASHLSNRTDNEIKNYWNTHLKRRLEKMGIDPLTHKTKSASTTTCTHGDQTKNSAANLSHMTQWENARLEAEARLVREAKRLKLASTNSFHQELGSGTTAPAALSLDLLKALQENWPSTSRLRSSAASSSSATSGMGNGIADLESPTSTLSLLENTGQLPALVVEEAHNRPDINNVVSQSLVIGKCNVEGDHVSDWSSDHEYSSKVVSHEGESAFMDFSDLLLDSSDAVKGEAQASVAGECDGKEEAEEDKDYWKSILRLVNSSPSNSPLF